MGCNIQPHPPFSQLNKKPLQWGLCPKGWLMGRERYRSNVYRLTVWKVPDIKVSISAVTHSVFLFLFLQSLHPRQWSMVILRSSHHDLESLWGHQTQPRVLLLHPSFLSILPSINTRILTSSFPLLELRLPVFSHWSPPKVRSGHPADRLLT